MERFRSAIRHLDKAVQQAPAAFNSLAGQNASARKLIQEIRNVLATSREPEPKFGRHEVPKRQIIRMAMDFVDQHDGEYLSLGSTRRRRTLRDAFHWYFGIAPVQYLNRRALHTSCAKLSKPPILPSRRSLQLQHSLGFGISAAWPEIIAFSSANSPPRRCAIGIDRRSKLSRFCRIWIDSRRQVP
jgi:hypothetical protein